MLHVEVLDAPENYLIRAFSDGAVYREDDYDAEMIVSIYPGLFIEVHGLTGKITRKQLVEGIKYLRELSEKHGLAVVAERMGSHRLPGFELNDEWWFLRS